MENNLKKDLKKAFYNGIEMSLRDDYRKYIQKILKASEDQNMKDFSKAWNNMSKLNLLIDCAKTMRMS